ncbi:Integrator complex subunit 2 [Podila epigama]|nr:Integrator complex subunit 2 [Podila epigama]
MVSASEAFRLLETGGDPRQFQDHDYKLFLPLLLARHSIDSLPFLIRYPETSTILSYLDLDYQLIQRQAKEELQLQKQSIGAPPQWSRVFETGTATDRARNPSLDIQHLIRDLRTLKDPETLITALVANHPSEYYTAVETMLDSDHMGNSKMILSRLCKLAVHRAWDVRQKLLDRRMFPNLAIELTIEHCHDEINFMNRILRGKPAWLVEADPVTKSSRTSILEFIFSSLNDELQAAIPNNSTIRRLLRILSGMLGLMNLVLSAEQLEISLQVLEMRPEPSTIDIKVCLILMCTTQLFKYSKSRIERVLTSLLKCKDSPQVLLLSIYFQTQQLLQIDDYASSVLSMTIVVPRDGFRPLETFFSTGFSDELLATCALSLGQLSHDLAKSYKSNQGITDTDNGPHAIRGNPSKDASFFELRSSANICVAHLLKRDTFHRCQMDARSWILARIIESTTLPLDVHMVPLLTAYAESVSRSNYITRIPLPSILDHFENPAEDVTPPKVLLALYMLLNNDVSHNLRGNMEARARCAEYPDSVFHYIQIRKILLYVQNHQGGTAFASFQPLFLKLVNAQFPELFDVTTLLMEEGGASLQGFAASGLGASNSVVSRAANMRVSGSEDEVVFKDHHFTQISKHLDNPEAAVKGTSLILHSFIVEPQAFRLFQRLPQERRQSMSRDMIQASLPSLLDPRANSTVLEVFKNTWDQLNCVMPHELWAMTINACRAQDTNPQKGGEYYNYEWLVQDPLLLFRVDFRVFRTPVVFRMFIQILGAVMVASRHYFRTSFEAHQTRLQLQDFGEAQLNTVISLHDVILIQMLLETCQSRPMTNSTGYREQVAGGKLTLTPADLSTAIKNPNDMDVDTVVEPYDEIRGDVIKEIRVVAFNFLHQQFIDNKNLAKLIHFQGYPLDLIPSMVQGVDSIHICLDFLPELLHRPPTTSMASGGANAPGRGERECLLDDVDLQVFALRLAVQLCERFPLANTMQMTKDVILPRLHVLALRTSFSPVVLESAVVLAKAFPTLRDDIIGILRETSGAQDKAALTATLKSISTELMDQAPIELHDYFKKTPIAKWNLVDFLAAHGKVAEFENNVIMISNSRKLHIDVRLFARTWGRYLTDELGAVRVEAAKEAASNQLLHGVLAEQSYGLAMRDMSNVLHDRKAAAERSDTNLGKHARPKEECEAPLAKRQNPFQCSDDEVDGEDAATLAQEQTHRPLNLVFDMEENFKFEGRLDSIDISESFTDYYEDAITSNYDADNVADFLATAGILFLDDAPTAQQRHHFGTMYKELVQTMQGFLVKPAKDELKEARTMFRDCRDTFEDEERESGDRSKARAALRKVVLQAEDQLLQEVFLSALKLHTTCKPITESDQVSGFVMRMLTPILDKADETRLA